MSLCFSMDSLRMSRARRYSAVLGPRPQRLPAPRSFFIEVERFTFLDDAEFCRKPIAHTVIQFVMLRLDGQIVKGAGHLFPKVIFACRKGDPAHESRAPFVASVTLQQMPNAMEMAKKSTAIGHESRTTIAEKWFAVYVLFLSP
jgi:hypothetical protein